MSHEVKIDGEVIEMTHTQYELLKLFTTNPNVALSREMIIEHIWGYDYDADDRTIDAHIKLLRSRLGKYKDNIKQLEKLGTNLNMKRNNLTIKSLIYFIGFSLVILLILWLTQVELLGVFYERYQLKNIESVASSIDKNVDNIELQLENYAYNNNMCIQYYKNNEIKEYNTKNPGCLLSAKNSTIVKVKKVLYYSNKDRFVKLYAPGTGTKSIIYLVRLDDNNFIFLNTTLEDINTASKILKRNLVYILVIIMLLSLLVSIVLAKKINKPILNLISSAKELGKGNYNVKFKKSNIAELDELADVLEVAASEMNKTEELRRDLLANVSHDLKTPLTMIKAYAEKVRDLSYKDKEKRERDLNVIIEEADRLNYLVNDLLDMSKIEAGADTLKIEEYDLIEDINTIIKRYEIVKETESYKFELDLPDKAIIKADRSKINQVIYNLINNAIEHTGDDLVVKIAVNKVKDCYVVKITDTGKGIAEEDKKLVWNKYYKTDKRHKRNVVGSGIGLTIVKGILESHNFEYGIDSKLNEYTTFYFKIKIAKKVK